MNIWDTLVHFFHFIGRETQQQRDHGISPGLPWRDPSRALSWAHFCIYLGQYSLSITQKYLFSVSGLYNVCLFFPVSLYRTFSGFSFLLWHWSFPFLFCFPFSNASSWLSSYILQIQEHTEGFYGINMILESLSTENLRYTT